MIAAWMLYCSLAAVGLFIAAALAERMLLAGRGPVRLVWVGAIALSLLVPAAAFRMAMRPPAAAPELGSRHAVVADQPLDPTGTLLPSGAGSTTVPVHAHSWRTTLARFDEPLAVVWGALSVALALNYFGGIVALRWRRRLWKQHAVLGVPVFVSGETGPAVVGVLAPAIVLPEWVLAFEPSQLALLLEHEQEHRRAGDGQLLTAARFALVLMPWNPALWWQILRLRVAVELDCDARVLQHADARSYGDLLLEVAGASRGPSLRGATAFAERATQLERRIRVLPRYRARTSRAARVLAACIGVTALTAAWAAPHPAAPVRAPAAPVAGRTRVPPSAPNSAVAPAVTPADSSASTASRNTTRNTVRNATSVQVTETTMRASDTVAPSASAPQRTVVNGLADSAFACLFDGITLAPAQETRARAILARLELQQVAIDPVTWLVASLQHRATLQSQRDSALRALVTSDADRAMLSLRLSPPGGGGRGRVGGAGSDSSATQGGTRMGGGGRVGGGRAGGNIGEGGGRIGRGSSPEVVAASIDALFRRLFDGLVLTAEQEARARALIATTQQELTALAPPPVRLRINPVLGVVLMPAPNDSELIALLSNSADQATLRSRIVTLPQ